MSVPAPLEVQQIEGHVDVPIPVKKSRIPGRFHNPCNSPTNTATPTSPVPTFSSHHSHSTSSAQRYIPNNSRLPRERSTPQQITTCGGVSTTMGGGVLSPNTLLMRNQQDVAILMQDLLDVQRQLEHERISKKTLEAFTQQLKQKEMEQREIRAQLAFVTKELTDAVTIAEHTEAQNDKLRRDLQGVTHEFTLALNLVKQRDRQVYGQQTKIEKMKITCKKLQLKLQEDEQKYLEEKKQAEMKQKVIEGVLEDSKFKYDQIREVMEERNREVQILNAEISYLNGNLREKMEEIKKLKEKNEKLATEKAELFSVCQELFEKFERSNESEKVQRSEADLDASSMDDDERSADDEIQQIGALMEEQENGEACKCLIM